MPVIEKNNGDGYPLDLSRAEETGSQRAKLLVKTRDPWLDLLRAAAITLVVIYHVTQSWPVSKPWLYPYTNLGAKGVDLFFVLSGWLIGGLFWSELKETRSVNVGRFWVRRWLRTIPPYAGGLAAAWIAVWLYRGEKFDIGYLFFIQNYYEVMPFFFVSWSLCVEEHFYLFLPLLFYLVRQNQALLLCVLAILPVLFRFWEYPINASGFGYATTATHLRADGLILGFGAAHLNAFYPAAFARLRGWFVLFGGLAAGLWALDLGEWIESVLDPLFVSITFLGLLIALEGRSGGRWFGSRSVAWLARISYSIYLIHALVIHAFIMGVFPHFLLPGSVALLVEICLILLGGWIFYVVFERFAFNIRERLAPSVPRAG